jgi:16S rRNA (cytosine1402-N4)-methyltransferase
MKRLHTAAFHVPILLHETVNLLLTDLDGIYIDGTVGGGGHSSEILRHLHKSGRLIGIDRDSDAVMYCREKFSKWPNQIQIVQGEIGEIDRILYGMHIMNVNGYLLDLGVSSHQIDSEKRGFSYLIDGPLDMRMDVSASVNALNIVNEYSEIQLANLFYNYGEERNSRRIARKIVEVRKKRPIETTGVLADIVRKTTSYRFQLKTLARIWQSIRIEVNNELEQLNASLEKIAPFLKPGGRIVVLSYESLTDRMVKRFLNGQGAQIRKIDPFPSVQESDFQVITRRVVRPSEEEIKLNPRARSARLRAGEKRSRTNEREISK